MLQLRAVDGLKSMLHFPQSWIVPGKRYEIPLDIVATEAHSVATLFIRDLDWFQISDDDGATFVDVGSTRETAVDLQAFTALERKSYILSYIVPDALDARTLSAQPVLGWGT